MDKNVSYVIKALNKLQMRKNNSYIAACSAYEDGENAKKNSYSAISWHEICSVMSSDVCYVSSVSGDFAQSH